ncbi:protein DETOXIFICATION 16-like [Gastrolobium bilobum]|uniref:protein DETOXIFICATION 16-like n=1 Tax=Gastrolobium bilobum TaxID=150636 RepID=UPI002AAF1D92|nr:protein DETOXIFICATION 16-like [Gastrolobium bilobum]
MKRVWKQEVVEEVKKQLWLAGPLFSVGLLQYSLQVISLMFVGHLGELPLAGASVASSFASVTGFNLLMGMASALDTLCGQSFGAEQHHKVGIHLQRAIFVLSFVSVFVAIIWACTKNILIAIHQPVPIAEEAGVYAFYLIPSLFAYGILQCLLKFLQTQNIVFPMMLSSAVVALLHTLLCWVFVTKSGLGSKGAAIANSISYWVNVLLMALYVKFSTSCEKSWNGLSKKALQNIPEFLKISIPSALMLCLKTWTFELMVLLCALLPNPELETSVLSICLNTFGIAWMIPFGLSCAASTRVSNELGAGHPQAAILAVRVALFLALVVGIMIVLVMILIRKIWGNLYSSETEVIKYVEAMMPILAISSFLDGIQSVLSGIARGSGWQKIGAYVNLGSFYFVGVPSSMVLAFVFHMKGKGLWLGIVFAFIVQVILFGFITIRTSWEKEANKAAMRVNDIKIPPELSKGDPTLPS